MSQSMSSSRVRRLTGLFALLALLGAVLSSAQPTAASTPRPESNSRLQNWDNNYALPLSRNTVPRSEYDDPHWRKPAIDLQVPVGTPVYAVKRGTVNIFYQADGCGKGITITAVDGAEYTYCHLNSFAKADGTTPYTGDLIGYSGNTGRSEGPHLHLQIKVNGVLHCPQNLLLAIYDGTAVPAPSTLPTSGCTSS